MNQNKKESIKEDIKKNSLKILEKYLDGREFILEKIEKWQNLILDELQEYLIKKYSKSKFILFCDIISKNDKYTSNSYSTLYINQDHSFYVTYKNSKLISTIRWFFCPQIKFPKNTFSNIQKCAIKRKISNCLFENLDCKVYNYNNCLIYIEKICDSCNKEILNNQEKYPCCNFVVGYIFEKPIIDYFIKFRIYGLEYFELNCSYSNDFLYAEIFNFLINN